jgi:hypothetical protein
VEAPAQGDEGGYPGEVENPGEHRASGGLKTRLGATYSRGEKGPEDEPLSQRTACLHHERSWPRSAGGRMKDTRSESAAPAPAGGPLEGRATGAEHGSATSIATSAHRPGPRLLAARAASRCCPGSPTSVGRPAAAGAGYRRRPAWRPAGASAPRDDTPGGKAEPANGRRILATDPPGSRRAASASGRGREPADEPSPGTGHLV